MKKPKRLTFDELFDLVALFFSCRGTCDRLRTATVIRDANNVVIAAGYNGALPGDPHCDDVGHLVVNGHCLRTNHGEENAILNCVDLSRVKGGIVTIIGSPCFPCARKLAALGPKKIRYIGTYGNAQGGKLVSELCKRRGITLEYITVEEVLASMKKAMEFAQGPGGPLKDFFVRLDHVELRTKEDA
ncbi:MAG: competence protein ComE [Candidatus Niyogibacteria bacterium]|nr:competence protein ComE [Candidatus Niyogibacteria bacterium]